MAAARDMPGVCGVFGSSSFPRTTRMPFSFQSVTDQLSFEPGRCSASTKYCAWLPPTLRIPCSSFEAMNATDPRPTFALPAFLLSYSVLSDQEHLFVHVVVRRVRHVAGSEVRFVDFEPAIFMRQAVQHRAGGVGLSVMHGQILKLVNPRRQVLGFSRHRARSHQGRQCRKKSPSPIVHRASPFVHGLVVLTDEDVLWFRPPESRR